jgi:carboxyl-terminal processing protease
VLSFPCKPNAVLIRIINLDFYRQFTFANTKMSMKKQMLIVAALAALAFTACKKKDATPDGGTGSATPTREDLLRDSVYLYTKEVYLWEDLIPAYDKFNPRQYKGTTEEESATKVMDAVRKLQPLDRFSFVTTAAESEGLQTGQDVDYGFFVKAASIDVAQPLDSVYWFVNYVYKASTAGQSGVQRGWYIKKINGTNIGYDNASINVLNDVFFGTTTSAQFEFVKPDGTSTGAINLSKSTFQSNSVLFDTVYNVGGKKAGYLVFNQFFGDVSKRELAAAFSRFQSQGINDLIVDLRNNRGGSTDTQDTLANLIAPSSANGQKMYTYVFNNRLQNNQHTLIRKKLGLGNVFTQAANTVTYEKAGSLNIPRVFFIVTGSSASASELLINNLKPYMDVKLIGDTTYGKPVGFFPIPIYDYAIYPISFKTVNSAGNADYYNGFAPDKIAPDGVNKNWGDVTEPSLASALKYISGGTFRTATSDEQLRLQMQHQKALEPISQRLESRKFSGMFR